jgi:hypothetical protein
MARALRFSPRVRHMVSSRSVRFGVVATDSYSALGYYVCFDSDLDRMEPIVAAFRTHESAHS